jgi:hypothetical protein
MTGGGESTALNIENMVTTIYLVFKNVYEMNKNGEYVMTRNAKFIGAFSDRKQAILHGKRNSYSEGDEIHSCEVEKYNDIDGVFHFYGCIANGGIELK